jgi:hypothetical protein
MYREVAELSMEGLSDFYDKKIKPVRYNVAVIGTRENVNQRVLEEMGQFAELTLEEVFGF